MNVLYPHVSQIWAGSAGMLGKRWTGLILRVLGNGPAGEKRL